MAIWLNVRENLRLSSSSVLLKACRNEVCVPLRCPLLDISSSLMICADMPTKSSRVVSKDSGKTIFGRMKSRMGLLRGCSMTQDKRQTIRGYKSYMPALPPWRPVGVTQPCWKPVCASYVKRDQRTCDDYVERPQSDRAQ